MTKKISNPPKQESKIKSHLSLSILSDALPTVVGILLIAYYYVYGLDPLKAPVLASVLSGATLLASIISIRQPPMKHWSGWRALNWAWLV
jgi:hypothetical protein